MSSGASAKSSIDASGASVDARVRGPDGHEAAIEADWLIGADGGRSAIRPELNGPEEPRFTYQVAWRATVPWARADRTPRAVLTMGPGRHVVTYPLRDHTLMNVVAVGTGGDNPLKPFFKHLDETLKAQREAAFAVLKENLEQ